MAQKFRSPRGRAALVAYERRAFRATENATTADATAAQPSACSAADVPLSPLARAAKNTPPKSPKTIAMITAQRPQPLGESSGVGIPLRFRLDTTAAHDKHNSSNRPTTHPISTAELTIKASPTPTHSTARQGTRRVI